MVSVGKIRGEWSCNLETPVVLNHDVSIRFYFFDTDLTPGAIVGHDGDIAPGGRSVTYGTITGKQLIFVQFHTAFVKEGEMVFTKRDIDGAYNKRSSMFPEDFSLRLNFDLCDEKIDYAQHFVDRTTWEADSMRQSFQHLGLSQAYRLTEVCHS
jgi:hypothetical protein